MPDDSPARVSFPVDQLAAPAGRDTISLDAPLAPTSDEVAAATREALGIGHITDGSDGHVYRLVSNNGVLGLEQVS